MASDEPPMGIGTTRLYGAAIAIVSGAYSIISPIWEMGADSRDLAGWIMLVVGIVVLVHGVVLLTPAARLLGRLSGPLMVLWAAVMLANQVVAMLRTDGMMMGMEADGGMIAIALLMLISGLIMIARPMDTGPDR